MPDSRLKDKAVSMDELSSAKEIGANIRNAGSIFPVDSTGFRGAVSPVTAVLWLVLSARGFRG